ncbi:YwaF family protein [Gracilimonas sediminicola]|uniref:TIGR02206 family membrane protein n=1 Tax=Gracilimonas sediminicola TaxID=2952158 RepID=A0A9X2L112_9BACT|nr:TIGR02206 family membrane protein [Gracilimonas sediminicola]MCP9290265.1 TIGR02206 family membrane protein [Gracilimonas sediminicola]
MNTFFDTTYLFSSYSAEHFTVLLLFFGFCIWFIPFMRTRSREVQRKVLLVMAVMMSLSQLMKIPLNMYTGTFDVTNDIPLHMCNFLPFVLVWVYMKSDRNTWSVLFFWVVLGVSQANLTPSVQFSLFHYDAIRYWMVHLLLVLVALYPAIEWGWDLKLRDVGRSVVALNFVALVIGGINLLLGSNYLYVMGKPPGTTFFSILPEWPVYLIYLELIFVAWSLMVYGLFRWVKRGITVYESSHHRAESEVNRFDDNG